MELELSPDQKLLMSALDGLLAPYRSAPTGAHGYFEYSDGLRQALTEGGFFDIVGDAESSRNQGKRHDCRQNQAADNDHAHRLPPSGVATQ